MKTKKRKAGEEMTEMSRWFTLKVNRGNYENAEFGASQKVQCPRSQAKATSAALDRFVRNEVIKSINQFKELEAHGEI